jgi:hypothetical protein
VLALLPYHRDSDQGVTIPVNPITGGPSYSNAPSIVGIPAVVDGTAGIVVVESTNCAVALANEPAIKRRTECILNTRMTKRMSKFEQVRVVSDKNR